MFSTILALLLSQVRLPHRNQPICNPASDLIPVSSQSCSSSCPQDFVNLNQEFSEQLHDMLDSKFRGGLVTYLHPIKGRTTPFREFIQLVDKDPDVDRLPDLKAFINSRIVTLDPKIKSMVDLWERHDLDLDVLDRLINRPFSKLYRDFFGENRQLLENCQATTVELLHAFDAQKSYFRQGNAEPLIIEMIKQIEEKNKIKGIKAT